MPRPATTELVTVLFTDVVSSTQIAGEVGDRRWKALVAAHHDLVRKALKRYGGRELDTAGDGFFATFGRPAEAIRCAAQVSEDVRDLGLEIRAGLHLGEAEVMGSKVGGVAVNTGARIMSIGGAGDVLVSSTVRDAVAGKGIEFEDRGVHQLKGLEGEFHLFGVVGAEGVARGLPLDGEEARRRRERLPDQARPRRRWWLVAAGVGVVAVVGIGLAVSLGSADPDETAPTGPGGSGAGRTLTEADAQVIELVPPAFAASCVATDPLPQGAVASATCIDDEYEVRYDAYADTEALGVAFASATVGLDLAGASCLMDRTASGIYTVDGGEGGRVACFVEQPTVFAHASSVVWTDDALLVLGRVTREDLTDPVNVPDLTLYEWWRTEAGPGPGGLFRPKDGSAELPSGVFEMEVTQDELGAQSDGLADERWLGTTTVELDGDTIRVTYADGISFEADLLWGKGNRLISRSREKFLCIDFGGEQGPRYESWTWRLQGDDLVLSDPSPGVCNDLRNQLAFEPLARVS